MSRGWVLAALGLALALAACGDHVRHRRPSARASEEADVRTIAASRQIAGEKQLDTRIQFGGGTVSLKPAPAGTLYRASLRYDSRQITPAISYEDGHLYIGMKGGNVHLKGSGDHAPNKLDVELGPGVPVDLNMEYGAGLGELELGGLTVRSARIATGASKTRLAISSPTAGDCDRFELQAGAAQVEVKGLGNLSPRNLRVEGGVGDLDLDFSGAWRGDVDANVNMGMGSLRLDVPRGVGVRVRKSAVLASFEGQGMVKQGDTYASQGYESATRHLNVEINAAFGSIRLNWIGDGSSF